MAHEVFHIEPGFEPMLAALGLDSLQGALQCQAALIKDQRGRRDVIRVEAITPDGQPLRLFVKRMTRSYLKDGLRTRLIRGSVVSRARIEFENTLRVIRAGFAAGRPVAWGEKCGALRERASVIITAEAEGTPLDQWLACEGAVSRRRRVLRELGCWLRELHARGIGFPDLFARHVFVNERDRASFCLIDLARIDFVEGQMPLAVKARDLAALHASVPLHRVKLTDRLRVLTAYVPSRSGRRELLRFIRS
ncbi:MAG: lipopolysaccharide kinase InaA family protein, partial [Phycisphaerae bacterium]|nr:lipopolysaccharide kinase InaA family protein [Phycisphaerae bacterium]MDW8263092.1 lipopolysaccharide kinase InaA family protein [Phycisphaerales bacterium]